MKIVLQRSKNASVSIKNQIVGKINHGLVLLVSFTDNDDSKIIDYMVDKVLNLRIFDDENGVMNKSIIDTNGSILSISQFTLYADTSKGRRPSYIKALKQDKARKLYDEFNNKLKNKNIKVETGKFKEDMQVSLINDGPVTIILERENNYEKRSN